MIELPEGLLAWKGAVVAAWLAAFFLAERLRPAAPRPAAVGRALHRLARNGVLWGINTLLSPLFVLPVTIWAAAHGLGWRPAWWDGPPALLLDLLLFDCLIYWWHRANHVVPFLWRFHEVHHLDATLDTTTALRFHFGEVLLSAAARAGVIVLLDVPLLSVVAFETLVLAATIFHHSNLALPPALERALARIVVTPSIHWVHHRARRRDTDSNYATVLSLWDPLFASRSPTARRRDMAIGVEGRREEPLARLLLHPLYRTGAAARRPLPERNAQ